jgi:hypothetical protein
MLRNRSINLYDVYAFSLVSLVLYWLLAWYVGRPLIPQGPLFEIHRAAESILAGKGWYLIEYEERHHYLIELSQRENAFYWQDIYALDASEKLITKHCHLFVCFLLPFVALFGKYGVLLCAGAIFLITIHTFYQILLKHFQIQPTLISVGLFIAGTPFLFQSYSASYDMLVGAMIALGMLYAKKAPGLSGFIIGLTIFIRPTNALYLPFCLIATSFYNNSDRTKAIFGWLCALLIFASYNAWLWGGPLITAHARMPVYASGVVSLSTAPTHFSLTIFISDLYAKFFGLENGYITFFPALWVLFLWYVVTKKRIPLQESERSDLLLLALTCSLQIFLVLAYEGWSESIVGNRYLFPTNLLLLICCCVMLELQAQQRSI